MRFRSLGHTTDAALVSFDGIVEDLGEFVRVVTPTSPSFYHGNYLISRRPPQMGDLPRWEAAFARHVATTPGVRHRLFAWEDTGERPLMDDFLDAGYAREENVTLATERLGPPAKRNSDAELRPLGDTDAEWESVLENQITSNDGHEDAAYRAFKANQVRRYRAMVRAGAGHWYGAFVDGRLAADMGVFRAGDVGRFQSVVTHPDFRRQGLCGTLVHFAGNHAAESLGVGRLVIVADENGAAKDIYRSVGFTPTDRVTFLTKAPTTDVASRPAGS